MPAWDEIANDTERLAPVRRTPLTLVILAAQLAGLGLAFAAHALHAAGPLLPLAFASDQSIHGGRLWQLLTYPFAQSLEIGPILAFVLLNFLFLQSGRALERTWGWRRLLVFYLGVSVYGATLHAAYQVFAGASSPALGPAGSALAALLAASYERPTRRVLFLGVFPMRAARFAWITIGAVLLASAAFMKQGVSPFAIFGAVGAAHLFCRFEPTLDGWLASMESRASRDKFLKDVEIRRRCDQILEKIQRQGMTALDPAERRILRKASRLYRTGEGR